MKKLYKKPKIKRVKLIAEEAILVGCRTTVEKSNKTCTNGGCAGSAVVST